MLFLHFMYRYGAIVEREHANGRSRAKQSYDNSWRRHRSRRRRHRHRSCGRHIAQEKIPARTLSTTLGKESSPK